VIDAQEAVRQRLSTQMHDGPAQALSNFMIRVDIASRLLDIDLARAKEELNSLKVEATRTFASVKGFITELRPMMLDDLGLFPTVRKYIDSFKEQSGIDINLTIKGQERRLAPYLEVMVFRAIQELIGNAYRQNQDNPGKVVINVQILIEDNQVKVVISDNGKGFDLETLEKSEGLGLKLIRERVEMLGGYFKIDSAVGQGCKVSFQVPSLETESNIIS
jgi:two-component system, NarL family, sensor histidine kinase DegS